MQGPGINRKDCLLVTDFGKFGFQSLLQRIAVLEKKLKVSSAVPRRLSIFFQDAQPPKQALRPNFPKAVTSRHVFPLNKSNGYDCPIIEVHCQKLWNVKNLILKQEQLGFNSGVKLVKSSELYCQTGHFGLNSDPLMELCI